jgi:hypothetical protein
MGNALAGGIYVVAATKGRRTEYWAAATLRGEAVEAVKRRLSTGWTASLTERRLRPEKIKALRVRPNRVRRLKEAL